MRLVLACREQPWRDRTGGPLRPYELALTLAAHHRLTVVTFSSPTVGHGPAYDRLNEACEGIVEIPLTTCRMAERPQFQDYASATQRLSTLLLSRQPRIIRRWHSPEFVSALRELRATGIDTAVMVRSLLAEMARSAGFERILVDLPDLENELVFRHLAQTPPYKSKPIDWGEWVKLRAYERGLPRRFWRVSVCKEEDRRFLSRAASGNVFLIPNGTDAFPPTPQSNEVPGELLFVGGLFYEPNIDAVLFFRNEILPLIQRAVPNVRFRIVGMNPHESITSLDNGTDCLVNGSVDDLGPYYAGASVVVVPMRRGAGSKIKVVEALARGKALVSTTFGAQGFDLRPGVDLEIADTAKAFADRCIDLLRDPARRASLAESGRARTIERYTWQTVTRGALDAVS